MNDTISRNACIVASAALLAGCGEASAPGPVPDPGRDRQIVNGQVDSGDPAVVALTAGAQSFCTGTLIRPTVVLTAAHCLPPNTSQFGLTSYNQIDVFFGTDVDGGSGTFVDVVDGWTHPDWTDQSFEDDIGLIRLATSGPATPIPFREQAMSLGEKGEPVRIIGFGITGSGNNGTSGLKREATVSIGDIYQYVFTMPINPSGTCNGDSGGTALMTLNGTEYVAGIHSRSDCETQSIDTRVDDYATEIYNFIGETPSASCDGDGQCASGCSAPDPDCPCASDGFCDGSCPNPADDSDCDSSCSADGVCDESCAVDPDCEPSCEGDGVCVESCGDSDPDCVPATCPADGTCSDDCSPDPDCWTAGVDEGDYDGVIESGGGCAVGGRRTPPTWLLGLIGAGLWLSRRRRAA